MGIFDELNIRMPGPRGARPSGLRAEAEGYAASLGLTPGGPGWGDAIRDYVLSGPAKSSATKVEASPPHGGWSTSTPSQFVLSQPHETEAPDFFASAITAFDPRALSDFQREDDSPAQGWNRHGIPPAMAALSSPTRKRSDPSARRPGPMTPREPPMVPEDARRGVELLVRPPSEWGKPRVRPRFPDVLNPMEDPQELSHESASKPRHPGYSRWETIAHLRVESPTDTARNRLGSSAKGRYQFMPDTFVRFYRQAYPDSGETRAEILAKINDGDVQDAVVQWSVYDNERKLVRNRFDLTPTNVYLLHVFDENGIKILRHPDWSAKDLLTPDIISRNKLDPDWTGAQIIEWARERISRPRRW